MAKNTNPITNRLLFKQNWKTNSLPYKTPGGHVNKGSNEYFNNKFIMDLIHGTFLKLGILTSEISISRNCLGNTTINFIYYPLVNIEDKEIRVHLIDLIKLIKALLSAKFPNQQFKLILIKAPHKFIEPKIINDYISLLGLIEEPNKIKFILLNLIKEYKWLMSRRTPRR